MTHDDSYRVAHGAPDADSGEAICAITGMYPADLYGNAVEAARLYGDGSDDDADLNVVQVLQRVRGNADALVTVFRAVPVGVTAVNRGDWVTASRSYAEQHGMHPSDPEQDLPVLAVQVRAGDLYTNGDSLHEWGWSPSL